MNTSVQLITYILGIYTSFLTWGYLQEQIATYRLQDGSLYISPFMTNLIQNTVASLVGLVFLHLTNPTVQKFQWKVIKPVTLVSVTQSLSSPLGMMSSTYVGYLLYALTKSCKLVPVMFVHKVWYKRRFPPYKYLVVGIVTSGVSLFSIGGKSLKLGDNLLLGGILLAGSLILDGITNSTQDVMFKQLDLHPAHLMFLLNLFSMVLTFFYCIISGEFLYSLRCFQTDPELVRKIVLYSLFGSLGQIFIFLTLSSFGSLILITVTVTRKMISMLMSVVLFGHQLTAYQWMGIGLVFSGVGLEAWFKSRPKTKLKDN
jgi:UDP-galactose transporter B1